MSEAVQILIVEDDEVDRMAVRRALRSDGNIEMFEAEDCRGAIALLREHPRIECVFIDYRLPDGNGLQLIEQLRSARISVPLVVLTGQGDEQIAVDLMKAGASDYLSKDRLSPETLQRSLQRALRIYRAEREAASATARLRESEERYRLVLEGSNEGIWDWNTQSEVIFCNDRLREILGLEPQTRVTKQRLWRAVHPQDRDRLRQAFEDHLNGWRPNLEVEFRVCWQGEERYCIGRGKAQSSPRGGLQRLSGVVLDITDRKRAEERSRFLAEASQLLAATLDVQSSLENLARLAVPRLADWCAIDGVDTGGIYNQSEVLKRLAVAHRDPAKMPLVWAMQRYLEHPDFGSGAVWQNQEPDVRFEITPEELASMAADEQHWELLQQLNYRSYICVPLRAANQLLGTLTLVRSESPRRYNQDDLILAKDLAQRAALAMENARLYRQAQEASNSLRQALWILGEQQQQLRTLQQLTNLINKRLSNLPELLEVMARATLDAIAEGHLCAIALYEPLGKEVLLTVVVGEGASELNTDAAFKPETGLLHPAFNSGQPLLIEEEDPPAGIPATIYAAAISSVHSGSLGLLVVGRWDREQSFDLEDRHLLSAVGEQAAIAIDNARSIKTLEEREERLERQNQILAAQNAALEKQQQQIRLQNLKLLEAARLKSQFIATMSHELRTPMNAIIGFSQLLLRQGTKTWSEGQQQMLERILSNGKTLLALIDDILDLSKLEAGRLELNLEKLNLEHLTRATVEELRSLAEEKNLRLEVDNQMHDPTVVNDRLRLRQILVNLLSNGIKFTEEGNVAVRLQEKEGKIVIAVQDTGIGMSEQQQSHIFEEFRQLDQSLTRKYSGTGLGLAITESLVQLMEGEIVVESELGKGSTFRVHLPRQVVVYGSGDRHVKGNSPGSDRVLLEPQKDKKPKRILD